MSALEQLKYELQDVIDNSDLNDLEDAIQNAASDASSLAGEIAALRDTDVNELTSAISEVAATAESLAAKLDDLYCRV